MLVLIIFFMIPHPTGSWLVQFSTQL